MRCSCHDWKILHHSPNLLNSALNCTAISVAVLERKAAERLEHPFLLICEQQEEPLHDQGHQLNHCPCPKCGLSLLHMFLKAGQASTNSPAPPACPPWPGRAAAPATPPGPGLASPVKPSSWPVKLATTSSSLVKPATCSYRSTIEVTICLCSSATLSLV